MPEIMIMPPIKWLPIDQYEPGGPVLLRWREGYIARGGDGELPRIDGRTPIMFARLPIEGTVNGLPFKVLR